MILDVNLNTVVNPVQNAEQGNLNNRPQGRDFSWYLDQVSKRSQEKGVAIEEVSQDNTSEIAALGYGYFMMDSLIKRKSTNKK